MKLSRIDIVLTSMHPLHSPPRKSSPHRTRQSTDCDPFDTSAVIDSNIGCSSNAARRVDEVGPSWRHDPDAHAHQHRVPRPSQSLRGMQCKEKRSQTHSWLLTQILHDNCEEIYRIVVHGRLIKMAVLFVIPDLTRRERTHG